MSSHTAVVLAAGEGVRLRPMTRNRPKPMLPAANRPILEYVLDSLVKSGVEEIVLVVGYERDRVQNYVGPTYRGRPVTYIHQKKRLGTGHALYQARDAVEGPFLVVNGDCLIDPTIVSDVIERFEASEATPTLAILDDPDPTEYGGVHVENGGVIDIVEHPDPGEYRFTNAGVYAVDSSIFEVIAETPRDRGELALTEALDSMADNGGVQAVETEGIWVDATYPWDLLELSREVLANGLLEPPEIRDSVWVAETATVNETATIQAPAVIGPDCEVGAGTVIGPEVALGRNVTVGASATIERAVIDDDTRIGPGSILLDTVTGQDVSLGPGTVVSGGPAEVRIGNEIFEDESLGALLADRVTCEGDVSFAPGTMVGPSAHLATGVSADGYITEGAEVRR